MRILFCNYEYPPLGGGGGVINALLAEELAKRHEVTVLTSQALALPSSSVERSVQVVRVPVFFRKHEAVANLASLLAFIPMGIRGGRALLSSNQYDIINTHFAVPSGPVGDTLSNFARIPNVLSVHGGDLFDPSKLTSPHRHAVLRVWIRYLLRHADAVVGQSKNTLENMRKFYAPEVEGNLIPLGIQRPRTTAASRRQYALRDDEILFVTVGRLLARKAVSQLIEMMALIKNERAKLLVIGTGPLEGTLKEEASERQVAGQIRFLGHVEESEKFRILQMCDVYVSSSQHEGFGLVFLEAMASRLPVVCYDYGGQTDFLRDQETGFLVPLNDLITLKMRCQSLIENPKLRKAMGETNAERVEDFYVDTCASRYEKVFYESIDLYRQTGRQRARPTETMQSYR